MTVSPSRMREDLRAIAQEADGERALQPLVTGGGSMNMVLIFARYGAPEIMNADQGSQFTSLAWTDRLKRAGARISMDGKGRCLDNIFIERLWRSLTYGCVYLHACEAGSQAKAAVGRWIAFCDHQRPRAAHGGQPPAVVSFNGIETDQQARRVA